MAKIIAPLSQFTTSAVRITRREDAPPFSDMRTPSAKDYAIELVHADGTTTSLENVTRFAVEVSRDKGVSVSIELDRI